MHPTRLHRGRPGCTGCWSTCRRTAPVCRRPAGRPLPAGARPGLNDWHRPDYGGPCPPTGRHRYFFKLYALDTTLPALHQPTKAAVERAMQGHVLASAELVGTYQKTRA